MHRFLQAPWPTTLFQHSIQTEHRRVETMASLGLPVALRRPLAVAAGKPQQQQQTLYRSSLHTSRTLKALSRDGRVQVLRMVQPQPAHRVFRHLPVDINPWCGRIPLISVWSFAPRLRLWSAFARPFRRVARMIPWLWVHSLTKG